MTKPVVLLTGVLTGIHRPHPHRRRRSQRCLMLFPSLEIAKEKING
jgi:hypothetical protein